MPHTEDLRLGFGPGEAGCRAGDPRRARGHDRGEARATTASIVPAAFVRLRQGELLELRRSDVRGITGRIAVTRARRIRTRPGAEGRGPLIVSGVEQSIQTESGVTDPYEVKQRGIDGPGRASVPVRLSTSISWSSLRHVRMLPSCRAV